MNVRDIDWQRWWPYGLGLAGLVLILIGGNRMLTSGDQREAVVVAAPVEEHGVTQQLAKTEGEAVVDVQGAVVKPGVYRVAADTRVAEVLMEAGGLSEEADTAYIARSVNQAAKVHDGMKIYIPTEGEVVSESTEVALGGGEVAGSEVVNVNTASESELDSLWGIGEARAQAIIENRPYNTLEELKEKAGIPENVLEENEGKMGI
jgi:competence protein ComEA